MSWTRAAVRRPLVLVAAAACAVALYALVGSVVLPRVVRPMLENVAKCHRGKSNWQSWHNAAMAAGGALLGEPE